MTWRDVATAELTIWGAAFEIAEHNSKPRYQGPKSWKAEAKMAGKAGRALGALGLVITAYDIYKNGWSTSNVLDGTFGIVSFLGLPGAIIGGVYFGTNLITIGVTGKSIGEHVDENFYVIPTVTAGFTPSIMLVPKN